MKRCSKSTLVNLTFSGSAPRSIRLFRSELIVGIAFAILMASLFAAQDAKKAEFEIFGYGFKNIGYHKEILLLLAALLSPIAAVLSAYRRYLIAIRNECLKKLVPDPKVRTFYSQLHVDDYFDAVMRDPSSTAPRGLTVFLSATFGLVALLLMLAFLIASFLLQVSVFYDVATNPASSKYVNAFVITLSLTSIALSWMIALLQLPLPETNPAFYARLSELKAKDKAKYEEEMRAVIAESGRRERLLFSVASLMVFMLAYATISTVWYPNAHDELGRFITRAFLGSLLAVGVGDAAASIIKKPCYAGFFVGIQRSRTIAWRCTSAWGKSSGACGSCWSWHWPLVTAF
jgi:hypothetical protein